MASRLPAAAAVPAHRFPEQDRLDAWREAVVMRLVRVDMTRIEHCVRDGNGDIVLVICFEGRSSVRWGGEHIELGPGDAILVPSDRVGCVEPGDNATSLALRLPPAMTRGLVAADAPLRAIPRHDSRLELLSTYVRSLLTTESPLRPSTAAIADRQLTELIAHVLDPATENPCGERLGGLKAARLKAVIAGIEQNLANPNLTAGWMAAKLGLSERYVQHLLAKTGTGFSQLVRRKRLEWARTMLEDRSAPHRRIADIAYAVGFNDLSNFNHAFRRHFGRTPSEIRRG